ncbi:MAG TPA: riboflavin biosynthesis protein RibF [Elusimicrobia bacterium]|nr:MAG: riboflavin biosynthesis protein RibF [Elusimicrobia bacterium RIFOXYA12_FULL_49_49]OGS08180.1 MAG: riboflavin biosynthesis protein RibF [Elusimicrobia bacterium RIFOXYA1_FULL_47_7]OGS11248.1 MAG: riboflavin biosynthesis protein RibF [Elusimicrobia bacterium RIFOXYB1_FULL_48_9]OGS15645.1 MAG: riboflavin biosynthesis protein RibF [Elusimicrobia bacterium RIFOXYA2_FULL_47_53]OGS26799.1 MAG: riboflavin biosynthesis protein RibF [Elusimicrobia bacterium RIFOXYB12_FULL_50_12]OGS30744.1 MAG: 
MKPYSAVAVGTFDGLHRGHQYLINRLLKISETKKLKSVVVALSAPVRQVPGVLSTVREKEKLLAQFPIDDVVILPNTSDITSQPADQFLNEFLIDRLKAREFVIGQDFAFGKGRKGDINWLKAQSENNNITVEVIKPIYFKDEVISSSQIRKLVLEGDIKTANQLLGSFYLISSKPVRGRGLGTRIGFPTINLVPEKNKLLPQGVFCAWCSSQNKTFPSVVNIGSRPTFFSDAVVTVEIHLLGYKGAWKSKETSIYLCNKLREEARFSNSRELAAQIADDVKKAGNYFAVK